MFIFNFFIIVIVIFFIWWVFFGYFCWCCCLFCSRFFTWIIGIRSWIWIFRIRWILFDWCFFCWYSSFLWFFTLWRRIITWWIFFSCCFLGWCCFTSNKSNWGFWRIVWITIRWGLNWLFFLLNGSFFIGFFLFIFLFTDIRWCSWSLCNDWSSFFRCAVIWWIRIWPAFNFFRFFFIVNFGCNNNWFFFISFFLWSFLWIVNTNFSWWCFRWTDRYLLFLYEKKLFRYFDINTPKKILTFFEPI